MEKLKRDGGSMDSKMSRRQFLKYVGLTTGVAMFPEHSFSQNAPAEKAPSVKDAAKTIYEAADHRSRAIPPLEHMLKPDVYKQMTKDLGWDKVYGPEVDANPFYGGRGDYEGHKINPGHDPGTDYPVPLGFPLVPLCEAYVDMYWTPSEFPGGTRLCMYPLGSNNTFVEYAHLTSRIMKLPDSESSANTRKHKFVSPRDIIARSGDTGRTMSPHLHIGIGHVSDWNQPSGAKGWTPKDFEKWNKKIVPTNQGRPFFWDGKTRLYFGIKAGPRRQLRFLERFVRSDLEKSILTWEPTKENAELAGNIFEYKRLIGNDMAGKEIRASNHFHDLRNSLAQKVLVEKLFSPASGQYSTMLAAHSYGRNPEDGVMVCLPWLSPDLVHKARIAVWEGGIKKVQGSPVMQYNGKEVSFDKIGNDFWNAMDKELGILE